MPQLQVVNATIDDDYVIINTLVDGAPIKVQCWKSYLDTLTPPQKRAYIISLIKAQITPPQTIDLSALSGPFA